ncbi:MAG: protein kinase [Solirubrobacteraceae bacterium]
MGDLTPGTVLAGCRLEGVSGRGGMGVIYRATELHLDRPVAVKLIAVERAADPEFRERFEREARLTAAIDHPNVIPIYAAGEEGGQLYLVMRWVEGTDLQALIRTEAPLAPGRAAALIGQVAAGLDAAHAAGLVHRDVKPANVLISGGGADEHVYLSDFGIVLVADAQTRITETGDWVGTVDFMAPEHLRGDPATAQSDVYSLGGVLHAALTGAAPFRRGTVPATIQAHLNEPPPRPSATGGVPAAFDLVIARALAKRPEDRYPTAGDLAAAAAAAAAGAPLDATGAPPAAAGTRVSGPPPGGPAAPARPVAAAGAPDPAGVTSVRPAVHAADGTTAHTRVVPAEAAATVRQPPEERTRVAGGAAPAAGPEAVPAPAPPPPQPPPGPAGRPAGAAAPPVKVHRRRRALAAGLVATAAVAGVAVAAALTSGGTARSNGPLTAGEVRQAAQEFAAAYGAEDASALARVLTPAVERVAPGGVQRGRREVLAEYRRQFKASDVREYRLDGLRATGGPVGRATGDYTVTRSGRPPIVGSVVLGVVRRNGTARIGLIAAEPRA